MEWQETTESAAAEREARYESFEAQLAAEEAQARELDEKMQRVEHDAANQTAMRTTRDDEAQEGMEVLYSGCYLDEDEEEREWWPEAILARRASKGKLYYKVKWRGHNLVTWELDGDIENRKAVEDYERAFKLRAAMRPTARRRFEPVFYTSKRLFKPGREPTKPRVPADAQLGPSERAVWSCEVERFIWIPYDEAQQAILEDAYRRRLASATVTVPPHTFVTVDLTTMTQSGARPRKVQRIVQRDEASERRHVDSLSLDELRHYIGSIIEFTPLHYEVLARLHEADKVKVTATRSELEALPTMTFAEMMEQIVNGVEYVGFSDECHICLEDYEPTCRLAMLPRCGHAFHMRCIRDYFGRYSKLCPVCKAAL
jgi:hypothetical protein